MRAEHSPSSCLCHSFQRWLPCLDTGLDAPIPLPNVSSKILAKVIEYCKYHVDAEKKADDKPSKTEEEIKTWDTDFVKVDQSTLFELILVRLYGQLLAACRLPAVAPLMCCC